MTTVTRPALLSAMAYMLQAAGITVAELAQHMGVKLEAAPIVIPPRSDLSTLALALQELAQTIDSIDGVPNAVCAEAAARLAQLHIDLTLLAPAISREAGKVSRRSANGKALRAAADRLVGEVVA